MKLIFAVLSLCLCLSPAFSGDPVVLNGYFVWNNQPDKKGDLRAEFTKVKEGEWTVDFHFTWEGEPKIYKGKADGSLDVGAIKGKVKAQDRDVNFTFEGNMLNGTLTGTHAFIKQDGTEEGSGTIELKKS